ncbi:hypothetical protein BV898_06415 [Hypsibius exemplaris]|uniref:Uncharacterized protein n=1 Tax=Hypsibius exemplaris TaxID=2072580 RepID=A0A1W0WWT7_HYPEX|nr:hypothetical protein BV898_06415 [Hypsibius exemplaris]
MTAFKVPMLWHMEPMMSYENSFRQTVAPAVLAWRLRICYRTKCQKVTAIKDNGSPKIGGESGALSPKYLADITVKSKEKLNYAFQAAKGKKPLKIAASLAVSVGAIHRQYKGDSVHFTAPTVHNTTKQATEIGAGGDCVGGIRSEGIPRSGRRSATEEMNVNEILESRSSMDLEDRRKKVRPDVEQSPKAIETAQSDLHYR